MTVTTNKMNGCRVDSRRERPVSLPLDDGAFFCNSRHYSDLPDFLKSFHSQEDEIYRARVGTENQRLGGRASSRSLAGRHGLIYGMEAGRFKYWAGGVVGHAGLKKCPRMVVKRMRIDRFESCIRRFESGPAQNIHKAAGGPSWIAGGLFYWRWRVEFMTEQTPLERLEKAINEIRECFARPLAEQLLDSSIKYIKHAEARIRELESKLKAWEDGPTITVMEGSFLAERWLAKPGVYHVKPKEADDAQGN